MSPFFEQSNWNGPYEANIPHDKSVSDSCGNDLNNTKATKPLSGSDIVEVRIQHNGTAVTYKTDMPDSCNYIKFPSDQRQKVGVHPHDTVRFWVRRSQAGEGTEIAIKPGSDVYHLADDGQPYCNHTGATKPGTSSNGFLVGTMSDVSDEWHLCKQCAAKDKAGSYSRTEIITAIRELIGRERDADTFNSTELMDIALMLVDSTEELNQIITEGQE